MSDLVLEKKHIVFSYNENDNKKVVSSFDSNSNDLDKDLGDSNDICDSCISMRFKGLTGRKIEKHGLIEHM